MKFVTGGARRIGVWLMPIMKQAVIGAVMVTALAFGLSSCSEDGGETAGNSVPADTAATQGEVEIESKGPKSFSERANLLVDSLFFDYTNFKIDPVDEFPRFDAAKSSRYKGYRRKSPFSNEYGKAVYPRLMFKAWNFASKEDALAEVQAFLASNEHSEDSLILGQPVKAFKHPNSLCGFQGTSFYMIQSSCMYQGTAWEEMKARFFKALGGGEDLVWEISCKAGQFEYH